MDKTKEDFDNLSPAQKKTLKLFSYYVQSYGHTETNKSCWISDCSIDDINDNWISSTGRFFDSYDAIDSVINQIIEDNELSSKSFSDCDNSGELDINIDAVECKILITLSERVYGTNESGTEYDFTDFKDNEGVVKFMKLLTELSIPIAYVEFNGGGDSGDIETSVYDENNGLLDVDYDNEVENFLYGCLSNFYSGWEINEGSFGKFVFYPIDNIIQLEFNENTEDFVDRGKVFYSEF
jgi:hypothetical protein